MSNFNCGICGISFKDDKDYERHIFHYKDERWCGTKILRLLEEHEELGEVVSKLRKGVR